MIIPFDGSPGHRRPTAEHARPWTDVPDASMVRLPMDTHLHPDFTHVHPGARLSMSLMRTPRIPGERRGWPMHADLGRLPVARVCDLGDGAPAGWRELGGVAAPMYRSEAAWIRFESPTGYPFAVKVLAGRVNAISGRAWEMGLSTAPTNHIVVPAQTWLDGVRLGGGRIRQFATADDEVVRLQLVVTPMKASRWTARPADAPTGWEDVWDEDAAQTCIVRLVPATQWPAVAREPMPHAPLPRAVFRASGIPWSDGFDSDLSVPHANVRLLPRGEP